MSVEDYTEEQQLQVVADLENIELLREVASQAIVVSFRKSELIEQFQELVAILKNTVEVQERTIETYKRAVDTIGKLTAGE